jgi:hypothetical protein
MKKMKLIITLISFSSSMIWIYKYMQTSNLDYIIISLLTCILFEIVKLNINKEV